MIERPRERDIYLHTHIYVYISPRWNVIANLSSLSLPLHKVLSKLNFSSTRSFLFRSMLFVNIIITITIVIIIIVFWTGEEEEEEEGVKERRITINFAQS